MSTNPSSSASLPNARVGKRRAWSRTARKNLRKFTARAMSIRSDCRRGSDLRETLEDEPRAVFRNVETQLHIRALHLDIGRLRVEEQIGIRQFKEALRFVANARRQIPCGLRGFGFEDEPRFHRSLQGERQGKQIAVVG